MALSNMSATTDYGSLLDHVYICGDIKANIDVVDTYYSDHNMLYITLNV